MDGRWHEVIVGKQGKEGGELIGRVEKYRPVHLDDVVSHQDITATSELAIDFQNTS